MEQTFNNIASAAPLTCPITCNHELAEASEKIRNYEPLLNQIATSFGFSNGDSQELVQQVCFMAYSSYAKQENPLHLIVFLAKVLVHRCIFQLSSQLFSQNIIDKASYAGNIYTGELSLQYMPLSLRAVYLLKIKFKFRENEIAEILNTTPVQVKQRLYKALAIIKNHQQWSTSSR